MPATELQPLIQALRTVGEDPDQVLGEGTAYLVAYGQRLVDSRTLPGVRLEAEQAEEGIRASLDIAEGVRVSRPIHLCFGLFERFGAQDVDLQLSLGRGAGATVWSHCLFTIPELARHSMNGRFALGPASELVYEETHYHGLSGGIEVGSRARIEVAEGAVFRNQFGLVQGRVGRLEIDYEVALGPRATAELVSRVYGRVTDEIRIREAVRLQGAGSRGLVKTRVAVDDQATAEVVGVTEGNAAGARGHVDCTEIVRGHGRVSASPCVSVSHPAAKVTHEAAIGSVDRRQLETLMAHGLTPEEAVEVIVRGLLK